MVDLLADYLSRVSNRQVEAVLPDIVPLAMLDQWPADFPDQGNGDWLKLVQQAVAQSNHLHHPRYVGHQTTAPLPLATLMEFVSDFLNNSSAVYEMGPADVAMEKRVIDWMAGVIGFDRHADGVFTSGGTIGNLTALLAARQVQSSTNAWTEGVDSKEGLAVLVSEQCHYSVSRAISIMGLGENAVHLLPVNDTFQIGLPDVEKTYRHLHQHGRKVMALVVNGCSTATGTYDPLEDLAAFCRQNHIWLHVDGAHGAVALLSKKYRGLLRGIEQADSVVWDAHKMLLMPALTTAVIFRNGDHSYDAFAQKASYLFSKSAHEEWYNFAHRTIECTKSMMGLKLYICLSVLGTRFFCDYVDAMYDLTQEFAQKIKARADFELAALPQSNIICFRYLKRGLDESGLNDLQQQIRNCILRTGRFYLVQTDLKGKRFLRCTIINPLTTIADLIELLDVVATSA